MVVEGTSQSVVHRDLISGAGSTLSTHELEVGNLHRLGMTPVAPLVQWNFDSGDGLNHDEGPVSTIVKGFSE